MERVHYYEARFDDSLHMVRSTKQPGMQHSMLHDEKNHCVGNAPLRELTSDGVRQLQRSSDGPDIMSQAKAFGAGALATAVVGSIVALAGDEAMRREGVCPTGTTFPEKASFLAWYLGKQARRTARGLLSGIGSTLRIDAGFQKTPTATSAKPDAIDLDYKNLCETSKAPRECEGYDKERSGWAAN